jgi:hypothetical protein
MGNYGRCWCSTIPWQLWEPYSEEFAKRESVARASRSISAIHTTNPHPKPSPRHAAEAEPYSEDFAKRESVARASRSISAIHTTNPRPKPSPRHAAEAEEKRHAEVRDASSRLEVWRKTMKVRSSPRMTTRSRPFSSTSSLGSEQGSPLNRCCDPMGAVERSNRDGCRRYPCHTPGRRDECRFLGYRRGRP